MGGIAFALAAVLAFAYMAHLLDDSRRRAEQYVSLSWGVLAGLLRALDIRDQRAARHAAAVARFASDMAEAVGMGAHDQELAHTAGLLHDIGHFALSDRVAERGRTLTEEDWIAIQQHPELGADMLRDLGMYGPIAEIVLSHHERIDGRGYPNGLPGEEIPEIAKIISVAEVYDTLTAADTYRTRMSSFEALRELRRVAGTQLDDGLRRGAGGVAERRGGRVPPRGRRELRFRARHGAADQAGTRRLTPAGRTRGAWQVSCLRRVRSVVASDSNHPRAPRRRRTAGPRRHAGAARPARDAAPGQSASRPGVPVAGLGQRDAAGASPGIARSARR